MGNYPPGLSSRATRETYSFPSLSIEETVELLNDQAALKRLEDAECSLPELTQSIGTIVAVTNELAPREPDQDLGDFRSGANLVHRRGQSGRGWASGPAASRCQVRIGPGATTLVRMSHLSGSRPWTTGDSAATAGSWPS